jgi:pimeloyl-ACP methyl ester carboxylesterase
VPLFSETIYRADVMIRGFEVLAGWSSLDRLDQLVIPALLIVGSDDVFTSPPQSLRMARRIPMAETVIIDGSGHFPWIQAPEAFFAAVLDWATRHLSA